MLPRLTILAARSEKRHSLYAPTLRAFFFSPQVHGACQLFSSDIPAVLSRNRGALTSIGHTRRQTLRTSYESRLKITHARELTDE